MQQKREGVEKQEVQTMMKVVLVVQVVVVMMMMKVHQGQQVEEVAEERKERMWSLGLVVARRKVEVELKAAVMIADLLVEMGLAEAVKVQ